MVDNNNSKNKKSNLTKQKSIGFHGFTRHLYKDVPDTFDPLKKLLFKIQLNLDTINPQPREGFFSYTNEAYSNDDTESIKSDTMRSIVNQPVSSDASSNQLINEIDYKFIEPSLITNFSTYSNHNHRNNNKEPSVLKWYPHQDMSGKAEVKYVISNQDIVLKYHVGDFELLKSNYPTSKYVTFFVKLLNFAFDYYLEDKRVETNKINKNLEYIHIKSTNPIKFQLFSSLHEYTLLDIFKIYFDFIIRMVEGQGNSLEWIVVKDTDYARFHNSQIQAAIDLTGLELISESDYKERNLFDFFKQIQYQLDVACQNFTSDKNVADYSIFRNVIKSFGKEELEDDVTFEIELTSNGSAQVYAIKDKKVVLIRNHLGDHAALGSKKNRVYDADIIKCFKGLINYCFKYLLHGRITNQLTKTNSKDYCFEVTENITFKNIINYNNLVIVIKFRKSDSTIFHFKGDLEFFTIEDVLCKYLQYISASVSKITHKNARKIIISSQSNYDIFRSKILWKAIQKAGYKLDGQNVYDTHKKKAVEDKLEILFNSIFKLLVANDLSKMRSEKFKKITNIELNETDDVFTFEFISFDTVKIAAAVCDMFVDLKNHIGDVDELNSILFDSELKADYRKNRDDIINFVKIIKLGFDHIGKSCSNEYAEEFNSDSLKIVSTNPVKFTIDSSIVYTLEDLFIKFFRYVEKSVSRRTSKPAKKLLLSIPPNMNILQKTLLTSYIEQAGLKCISVLAISTTRLLSLEFDKKFKTSGKYILIDMNTKSLTLTLFEFNADFNQSNLMYLKNKSNEATKVQIDFKKHKKFNIMSTLFDNEFEAKELEKSIQNLLINSSSKLRDHFQLDKTLLHKYSMIIQDQFSEGIQNGYILLDEKNSINVTVDKVNEIIHTYAEQTNKLLETCLIDNNLDINNDIIRIDYTCRLFSKQYGDYLKSKYNTTVAHKFNCIDGFNTQDIYDYLNDLESNSDFLSTSLSTNIGFAIAGGIFDIHLRRNQQLPCSFSKSYITAFDYQTELLFPMFMGERPLIRYCESLGQIKVKNLPKSKAGELSIEMTLSVDKNENLNVVAVESKSNKNLPIEFQFIDVYESKGFKLILDAIKYKVQDTSCEMKVKEFKLVIKNIRENYKDYRIREEMNVCLNNLNKSKDIITTELASRLLNDLYTRLEELNLKIDREEISKQLYPTK